MKYKPVIGLEIHAELKTKTKMFCDSLNDPDEKRPNINVCPVCMAHPGSLPVINEEAVKKVIMAGLALNCTIARDTFFERKNYFYPDLPKGYQISQYEKPLCEDGYLDISNKKIRIKRIHLEEDAGRLYHPPGKEGESFTLVDYNRAGMPLMELVTEPDLESGKEVKEFAEELQLMWRYVGVSDADMEKGLMRVEVNISLMNEDGSFGTKVEVKNLNSIRAAADSVDYEIKRQKEALEAGEKIVQETRGWDENKKQTVSQRSKEEAHDYRYFPEPDLPPLNFSEEYIEVIKADINELPEQRRQRFKSQYGLPDADVGVMVSNKSLGDFYEHLMSELLGLDKTYSPKVAANYLITNSGFVMGENSKISPENFAQLMVNVYSQTVSSSIAGVILKETARTGQDPDQIIREKGLVQVSDVGLLESAVDKVIADNPKAVEDFRNGKEETLKFLIGMVMRETKGKANPKMVEDILRKKIK